MNQKTQSLESVGTLEFIAYSAFTLGLYWAYWYVMTIRGITRLKANKTIIFTAYVLIIYTIINFTTSIYSIFNQTLNSSGEASALWLTYEGICFVCYLVFIFTLRKYLNDELEIDPDSKYHFKMLYTILLGPIYINFNINKIQGIEK